MNGLSPCLLWKGAKMSRGYGNTYYKGRTWLAHRLTYKRIYGPIPKGMFVCHKCDVKLCIEPTHLELGTPSSNTRDAALRIAWGLGEKNPRAKLTTRQAVKIFHSDSAITVLSRKYGMSWTAINAIKIGRKWKRAISEFESQRRAR